MHLKYISLTMDNFLDRYIDFNEKVRYNKLDDYLLRQFINNHIRFLKI